MSNVRDIKVKAPEIVLSDGEVRHLKYTLNGLAELEEIYGSVEAAFEMLEDDKPSEGNEVPKPKKKKMKVVRDVLWAGLLWESPNLTKEEVGNLIDLQTMQDIMVSMGEAFGNSMPAAKEEDKAPNP